MKLAHRWSRAGQPHVESLGLLVILMCKFHKRFMIGCGCGRVYSHCPSPLKTGQMIILKGFSVTLSLMPLHPRPPVQQLKDKQKNNNPELRLKRINK